MHDIKLLLISHSLTINTDCPFYIAPKEDLTDSNISLVITERHSTGNQVNVLMRASVPRPASRKTDAVVVFNGIMTNQIVGSAVCNITNLQVYRGRRQVIEISHKGFSLNEGGNIQVSNYFIHAVKPPIRDLKVPYWRFHCISEEASETSTQCKTSLSIRDIHC